MEAITMQGTDWPEYTTKKFPYMYSQTAGPSNALGEIN